MNEIEKNNKEYIEEFNFEILFFHIFTKNKSKIIVVVELNL